jgi:hypothetical protein
MIKQILFFIILVLLLLLTIFKKNETYNEIINLQGDFYIPQKNSILNFDNNSINSHRICIYDDTTDPNNIDIECIDAETLLTTLKLPDIRKTEICIDNICIHQNDIKIMNGTTAFKIQSKNTNEDIFYDKCLGINNINTHICGESRQAPISTLLPGNCDTTRHTINFKLEHGDNKDSYLRRKNLKRNARAQILEKETSHHNPNPIAATV